MICMGRRHEPNRSKLSEEVEELFWSDVVAAEMLLDY